MNLPINMNIQDFSNYLNTESINTFKNDKISLDTKLICMWLYYICKVLLSMRGVV
jgi:hypothetical protein